MSPRKAATLVLLLAAMGTGGCAHAPWHPYGGWKVARTKHITIYTDTAFLYSTTLDHLELAYAALGASLFKTRTIAPVEVLFMEEPGFVATLGRNRAGVTIARLPGRGQLGHRGLVVLNETAGVPAAAHRLAHLFLHALAPRAPLWVHEGYASYAETLSYRSGDKGQLACLGNFNMGARPQFIPLEELFSWTWRGYDESKKSSWYRQTARALFDYFLIAENGTLRGRFADLMVAVNGGQSTKEALAAMFPGMTVATLEQRVIEHFQASQNHPRGLCPIPFAIPDERAADVSKPRLEPLEEDAIPELMLRLWMLPRRAGYVDWYPPEVLPLGGDKS
jgi:hypothetical protein